MAQRTIQRIQSIYDTARLALMEVQTQSDEDDKYDTIRNAYEEVRDLQPDGTEETDHSETPRAAMEEYLTEAKDAAEVLLDAADASAVGKNTIPDPLPEGIVFIPEGGSGSGSASGS